MPAHGVELHVATAGTGIPIILLHGFPECWYSWRRQIPVLANAGFHVMAPDMRGYNLSDRPAGVQAYHLRNLVADVAALVQSTRRGCAHIVGHDWGGIVAWTFAGMYPEMVDRLVILNAPHMRIYLERLHRPSQLVRSSYLLLFQIPRLAEFVLSARNHAALRRMFRHTPGSARAYTDEDVAYYIDAMSQPGALTAALNYYRANRRRDAIELARSAETRAHTLVIWGDRDPALHESNLEGLVRVAPKVRVHEIRSAGHWVHNEAPNEVNRVLLAFLHPDYRA